MRSYQYRCSSSRRWKACTLGADSIGLEGGLNLYAYVHTNPVNLVDPTGEFAFIPVIALILKGAAIMGGADFLQKKYKGYTMKDFLSLFVISFVLLVIAWCSLKKGMQNEDSLKISKEIKIGMNALIWGIAMQFLLFIVWLYSYYIVSGGVRPL